MKMLVLGAGLQGSACAYDLLQNPDVTEVRLADIRVQGLEPFMAAYAGRRLIPTPVDVRDEGAVRALLRESDAVLSALMEAIPAEAYVAELAKRGIRVRSRASRNKHHAP